MNVTVDDVFRQFAREVRVGEPWHLCHVPAQTYRVKEALQKVGEWLEPSCDAYYSAQPKKAEFMLDFCCMHRENHKMLIAAESEWVNNAAKVVDDDFQKLVYVKSLFRVMIFRMQESQVLKRAEHFLREYQNHSVGDSYIFARIDWEGNITGWKMTVEPNNQIAGPIPIQG